MRVSRFNWDGEDARALAGEIRAPQPPLLEVAGDVAEIIAEVAAGGDRALIDLERRFGGHEPAALRVPDDELAAAPERVPEELADALRLAAANITRVAETEAMADLAVTLPQGHSVRLRSVPVAAVGAYVPGGRASYPSSALMCALPAKVAGVERVAVSTPSGDDGAVPPSVLAACAIAGVDEVYAIGGVQAVAALALGTGTVAPVDVVVGPGNRFVQEAKRQVMGLMVGIDGVAGPSELMVICDAGAEAGWLARDLCAQAEHGADGMLAVASPDADALDRLEQATVSAAEKLRTVNDAPLALVEVPSLDAGVELANAIAPEHLQLACEGAERLAEGVRSAGCVFVGSLGATAFGDYAAGSNHVLPTGGAGRFTGPLGPAVFRRRIATVEITDEAARELAPAVATLARIEGFPVHAESVEARAESAEARAESAEARAETDEGERT
ncbi:MAG: histidinol dehydrogenase [Solirubrobacterales bacterium]